MLVPVLDDTVKEHIQRVSDIFLTEVNVKQIEFLHDTTGIITKKIKPNFKTLGKVYGPRMKEIAAAFGTLDQATITAIQNAETSGTAYTLALPGGEVVLNPGNCQISSEDMPGWLVASEGALTVALDVEITPALREEGVARELVNRNQNLRKTAGFEVTDRIDTVVSADAPEISVALASYGEWIGGQTLSRTVTLQPAAAAPADAREVEWTEGTIKIDVKR